MNCRSKQKQSCFVAKALDPQSRGPLFKSPEWLQGRLSLSSFLGRSSVYQEFLGTLW